MPRGSNAAYRAAARQLLEDLRRGRGPLERTDVEDVERLELGTGVAEQTGRGVVRREDVPVGIGDRERPRRRRSRPGEQGLLRRDRQRPASFGPLRTGGFGGCRHLVKRA